MPEAMAAVKAALGPEAVIVQTGNVVASGGTLVEIRAGVAMKARAFERLPVEAPRERAPMPGIEIKPQRVPVATSGPQDAVLNELAAIKRLLGRTMMSWQSAVGLSGLLGDLLTTLIDSGMPVIEADELVGHLRDELSPAELADPATLRHAAARRIESLITIDASPLSGRVVALVGPSGCGKTTTAAKLAAIGKYRRGKGVALISCDSARLGGTEHLALYAAAMDIPIATAVSAAEMQAAFAAFADRDLVIIDTPGCGPRDPALVAHLARVLQAAACEEVHLVLAANVCDWGTRAATRSLALLNPTRAIITKLDEAGGIGHILAAARAASLAFAFTCGGPNVPDNIEAASAARLARRMIDPVAEPGAGGGSNGTPFALQPVARAA